MATIGKMLSHKEPLFQGFGFEINTILLNKQTGVETLLTKLVSPLFHFEGDKEYRHNLKEIEVIVPNENKSDYFFYSSVDTSMYKNYFQINSGVIPIEFDSEKIFKIKFQGRSGTFQGHTDHSPAR